MLPDMRSDGLLRRFAPRNDRYGVLNRPSRKNAIVCAIASLLRTSQGCEVRITM